MNATAANAGPFRIAALIRTLLLMVFLSAGALSIKAAYDLTKNSEIFPAWFVPSFIFVISILISISLYFVLKAQSITHNESLITDRQSTFLWIFMVLSFLCTTSVHGFYPFHSGTLAFLPTTDIVMKTNYAIAVTGLLVSAALACLYLLGQKKYPAVVGLLLIPFIMLIPNDNCANPFNYWWIDTIGASPLMYVPNMYAALFVTCGLSGIHTRGAVFLTLGICLASLMLGLGHQFRIIW